MARSKVWIEAQEAYLISHHLITIQELKIMSDDELSKYFYNKIKLNELEEDAKKFIHKWCMQYK